MKQRAQFLERRHTQKENDSMHSCIETASRSIQLILHVSGQLCLQVDEGLSPLKSQKCLNLFDYKELSEMSGIWKLPVLVKKSIVSDLLPVIRFIMPKYMWKCHMITRVSPVIWTLWQPSKKPQTTKTYTFAPKQLKTCTFSMVKQYPKAHHGFYQSLSYKKYKQSICLF